MLSDTLRKALNDQINLEFTSAYAYLAMAAYFDAVNLPGFCSWMKAQAKEEVGHGMRLFNYLTERGSEVGLAAIAAPEVKARAASEVNAAIASAQGSSGVILEAARAVMGQSLAHEQKVTASINRLFALARQEGDFATETALHWFIDEQVEEEDSIRTIVDQMKIMGEQVSPLFQLDRRLGEREG